MPIHSSPMNNFNQSLSGKSALITGASAGIGKSCALALAKNGVRLYLTGRKQEALFEVKKQCQDFGVDVLDFAGDLNDRSFVRKMVDSCSDADFLVNNAGILTYAPVLETSTDDCEKMFATNVVAAYDVARSVAEKMVARGGGHMIFVTSMSARNVNAHAVVYAATKHAVSAFAKGFRVELKSQKIKVTEIAPGMVDTDMRNGITHPEVLKSLKSRTFKPISPDDVASGVVFALSSTDGCCPDLLELRPALG